MAVQDDQRELAQIELFQLDKPISEGRSGIDATLTLTSGQIVPFELKSTTDGSVTTARDFGYDHIRKWRNKHFLISKFSRGGAAIEYTLYGGPSQIEKWIDIKEAYIKTDFQIADITPGKLELLDMFEVIGEKQSYSLLDAQKLQKKQYSLKGYRELMDLGDGYSQQRMLSLFQERCAYLLKRGSTLNNPHISKSFFSDWPVITSNHATELRKQVESYLSKQDTKD